MELAFSKYDHFGNKTMRATNLGTCPEDELILFPSDQETLEIAKLMKPDERNFIAYKNFRKLVKYLACNDYFSVRDSIDAYIAAETEEGKQMKEESDSDPDSDSESDSESDLESVSSDIGYKVVMDN